MKAVQMFRGALILAACAMPPSLNAQERSACDLRFAEDSLTVNLFATSVGHSQRAIGDSNIRVRVAETGEQSGTCRADLRLSRLNSDQRFPDYLFTIRGRAVRASIAETVGSAENQFLVTIPKKSTGQTFPLQIAAPTEWGIQSGQYVEQLQLSLVNDRGEVMDRLPLNLVLDIPKTVDVMFVGATGTGQTSTINLGDLSQTEETRSLPFGVKIWSTSNYAFGFSSENNGRLLHREGRDAIPYELRMDNRRVPLDDGANFSSSGQSERNGDIYRLRVAVPPRRSVAGRYQDRVTVTVSAL